MVMRYVIPPIGYTPRTRATLLGSAASFPDEAIVDERGIPRWMQGVTFQSVGCDPIERIAAAICEAADKQARELGDIISFDAFTVYDAQFGSLLCTEIERLDTDMALRAPAMVSAQIAAELMGGGARPAPDGNENPTLASAAALVAGGPYRANDALALLEQAAADFLHGGMAYIHMTPRGLSLINFLDQGQADESGRWTTAQGHVVIADAGYDGIEPLSNPGDGVEADEWWYVSGPVFWALSEFATLGLPYERIDFKGNRVTAVSEATAAFAFDPCAVVAVPVCYESECAA